MTCVAWEMSLGPGMLRDGYQGGGGGVGYPLRQEEKEEGGKKEK